MTLLYKLKRKILTKKVIERNDKLSLWILENSKRLSLDEILSLSNRCNRIYRWFGKNHGKRV